MKILEKIKLFTAFRMGTLQNLLDIKEVLESEIERKKRKELKKAKKL